MLCSRSDYGQTPVGGSRALLVVYVCVYLVFRVFALFWTTKNAQKQYSISRIIAADKPDVNCVCLM